MSELGDNVGKSDHSQVPTTSSTFRSLPRENNADSYNLISFLKSLAHQSHFENLYTDVGVVLALFRSLSNIDKVVVLRLLDLCEPVRWEPFIIWLGGDRRATIHALNNLRSLRILLLHHHGAIRNSGDRSVTTGTSSLSKVSTPSSCSGLGPRSALSGVSLADNSASQCGSSLSQRSTQFNIAEVRYQLHPVFQKTLKLGLSKGLSAVPVTQSKPPKHFPTRETLHAHVVSQWTYFIHWLIHNSLSPETIQETNLTPSTLLNADLLIVIERLGLHRSNVKPMKLDGQLQTGVQSARARQNKTFQWLLNDRRKQVFSLCVEYIRALHCGFLVSFESDISPSGPLQDDAPSRDSCPPTLQTPSLPSYSNDVVSRQTLEVVRLLFTLSEVLIGQPCSMGILSVAQRRFIQLAYNIGLVWLHKPTGSKHFFPTPLAKVLQESAPSFYHILSSVSHLTASLGSFYAQRGASGSGAPTDTMVPYHHCLSIPPELYHSAYGEFFAQEQSMLHDPSLPIPVVHELGIIVESNFKVYANTTLTTSFIPILLARLCEIQVVMPNMIVAKITRDSIMKAYKAGVTADQVIHFFNTHAHPSIHSKSYREGKPLIPDNVVSQMKIWESERRRLWMTSACLFEFSKESDLDIFSITVNRARGGWLIFNSEIPSSSSPTSKAFLSWKTDLLERKKNASHRTTDPTSPWPPVLAIRAKFKDNLIEFIRNATRSLNKKGGS